MVEQAKPQPDTKWTLEEFLRNVYGWNDSCFIDNEDYLFGYSVRHMMQAWADYSSGRRIP